jgi:hypothetical protein
MTLRPRSAFFLVLASCIGACSSSSSSSLTQTREAQACLDAADVVARAAQRCGQDYKANYDAFVQSAANGNCANIIKVRDETSLRQACFPSLVTVSCEDLKAGRLDASCSA